MTGVTAKTVPRTAEQESRRGAWTAGLGSLALVALAGAAGIPPAARRGPGGGSDERGDDGGA